MVDTHPYFVLHCCDYVTTYLVEPFRNVPHRPAPQKRRPVVVNRGTLHVHIYINIYIFQSTRYTSYCYVPGVHVYSRKKRTPEKFHCLSNCGGALVVVSWCRGSGGDQIWNMPRGIINCFTPWQTAKLPWRSLTATLPDDRLEHSALTSWQHTFWLACNAAWRPWWWWW